MQPRAPAAAIGIVGQHAPPAEHLLDDEDVVPPRCDHARRRRRARKAQPISGEPERSDGAAEHLDRGAAAAERATRATGRMRQDLRIASQPAPRRLRRIHGRAKFNVAVALGAGDAGLVALADGGGKAPDGATLSCPDVEHDDLCEPEADTTRQG